MVDDLTHVSASSHRFVFFLRSVSFDFYVDLWAGQNVKKKVNLLLVGC